MIRIKISQNWHTINYWCSRFSFLSTFVASMLLSSILKVRLYLKAHYGSIQLSTKGDDLESKLSLLIQQNKWTLNSAKFQNTFD